MGKTVNHEDLHPTDLETARLVLVSKTVEGFIASTAFSTFALQIVLDGDQFTVLTLIKNQECISF